MALQLYVRDEIRIKLIFALWNVYWRRSLHIEYRWEVFSVTFCSRQILILFFEFHLGIG